MSNRHDGDVSRRKFTGVEQIEEEVRKIPISPLGQLIARVVDRLPGGPDRALLERIKNMKQGTFTDLEDPQFRSFLVSYLRIDNDTMQRLCQILRTERLIGAAPSHTVFEMAARGDVAEGPLTAGELGSLLARRRF